MNPRKNGSGNAVLELQAEEGKDIRAAAARAIVAANIDLLSMSQVSLSLEDVFLELTTKDAAGVTEVAPSPSEIFSPIATAPMTASSPSPEPEPSTAESSALEGPAPQANDTKETN